MPIKCDLKPLKSFVTSVNAIANKDIIAQSIAERGKDTAETFYGSAPIEVSIEHKKKGVYNVVASGEQVAYFEYGTGYYAKGSYPGELPKGTITFTQRGKTYVTNGWEYYYPNKRTKVMKSGRYVWRHKRGFEKGQLAMAQMWKTAQSMKRQVDSMSVLELMEKHDV